MCTSFIAIIIIIHCAKQIQTDMYRQTETDRDGKIEITFFLWYTYDPLQAVMVHLTIRWSWHRMHVTDGQMIARWNHAKSYLSHLYYYSCYFTSRWDVLLFRMWKFVEPVSMWRWILSFAVLSTFQWKIRMLITAVLNHESFSVKTGIRF